MVSIFRWDDRPDIELKLSDYYDEYGNSYQDIADKLNEEFRDITEFTYNSVRNRIRRSSVINYIPSKRGKGIFANVLDDEPTFKYEEEKEKIINLMNRFDMNYAKGECKVLDISDVHVPFADMDVLEKIVLSNQDADILTLGGDFLDYYGISKYGKSKNLDVKKEYQMGFDILKVLSKIYDLIVIFDGNHERRIESFFENKVVTALSGYLSDKHRPLDEITRYFDNVYYVSHWWVQLGDMVFAHPGRYSKVNLRSVENVIKYLIENRHEKEFANFEGCMMGHTHVHGRAEIFGRYGFEIPCTMNLNVDYRHKDAKGKRWENGYGIVTFNNGVMDYNRTRDVLVV